MPEAIASAESARAAFKAAAATIDTKGDAANAAGHHESGVSSTDTRTSVNANERDEKVSRLVARGPDGTRGFHTTVDGKRWTGVEAWVVSDIIVAGLSSAPCLCYCCSYDCPCVNFSDTNGSIHTVGSSGAGAGARPNSS